MTDRTLTTEAVIARINEYLANGGLFNPELMDHIKVRDLIIDARCIIEDSKDWVKPTPKNGHQRWCKVDRYDLYGVNEDKNCNCGVWNSNIPANRQGPFALRSHRNV